jgi:hypothetical protein
MLTELGLSEAQPITLAEQFAEQRVLLFTIDPGKMLPDA